MSRMRTLSASFMTGIILAGFPLLAIARHSYIEDQDIRFSVPSNISPRADIENFDIWSDINKLDLDQLSGRDGFLRGQTIYVHFSKGPNTIAYPFAVTSQKPENLGQNVFVIRGKVTGRENNNLVIRYNFETFLPSKKVKQLIHETPSSTAMVELAVNDQGIARLFAIEIEGKKYPYRKIEVPEALEGLTQ